MDYDQTADTTADLDQAWTALTAVTTYPQWTASMTSVEPLDDATLQVGHRFRIRQPGLPPVVWRVSEVRDGESFSWQADSPGVHTLGFHRLARNADGTTRIAIGIRQNGALAGLLHLLIGARTRRYLQWEAAGLKAAAESGRGSGSTPQAG